METETQPEQTSPAPEPTPVLDTADQPDATLQSVLQEADKPDTSLISEMTKALKPGNGHASTDENSSAN